jgi:hypothetical protein
MITDRSRTTYETRLSAATNVRRFGDAPGVLASGRVVDLTLDVESVERGLLHSSCPVTSVGAG